MLRFNALPYPDKVDVKFQVPTIPGKKGGVYAM